MSVAAPEKFAQWCARLVAALPLGLDRRIAPTLVGFALINGLTFTVDLVLLGAMHGGLGVAYPVALSLAYGCAFALSYLLNRYLNFRSHAPVGPQVARYVVIVVLNYLVFILALSTLLTGLGVDYRAARVVAGACEAGFLYVALRWLVFRR